jgi:hypothetical protein
MGPCAPVRNCALGRDDSRGMLLNQQIAEIAPLKILALDQLDLPVPFPSFQPLLAGDSFVCAVKGLDVNQAIAP